MDIRDDIAVAITGASGVQYGLRLLEVLVNRTPRTHLMISGAARVVIRAETDWAIPARPAEQRAWFCDRFGVPVDRLRVYAREQWMAPLASGSNCPRALAVCPCTMGTLGAIAAGMSDNLIERAADVVLKERRRLVLVVRETPLSEIHLRNMLRLTRMGAVILPASPGFYGNPDSVDALVDFVVARTLDQLGVAHTLMTRWSDDAV